MIKTNEEFEDRLNKICTNCKILQPLDNFYRDSHVKSGYHAQCKKCSKIQILNIHVKNQKKERIKANKYYHEHKVDIMKRVKKYNKEKCKDYVIKNKAYCKVYSCIKKGKIIKMPCAYCGSKNVHAHHADYNKPLEIIWLCPIHHRQIHTGSLHLYSPETVLETTKCLQKNSYRR